MVKQSVIDQIPGLAKYVLVVSCIALSDLAMSDLSWCASPNPGPNGPEIPTKRRFWRRGERAARRTRNARLVPAYVPESGITEVFRGFNRTDANLI